MSRKETVIVSIVVNLGFLGLLFFLAAWGTFNDEPLTNVPQSQGYQVIAPPKPETVHIAYEPTRDEIDLMLKNYAQSEEHPSPQEPEEQPSFKQPPQKVTEVTVKRGDSLDKISRANGTTVKAIMQANHLTSPRIDVGQVLKIPLVEPKEPVAFQVPKKAPVDQVEYYTLKSGDNPWNIAKKFKVRFDELLDLNGLDEEKARNLKPGDTLRVK